MAFHDVQFPTDISYGSTGGPGFSTDIVINHGGYEQRNSNWAQARGRYNVAHGIKTQNQLNELVAFFRARKGRAHSFRFKDWTDYEANGVIIGTGDGSTVEFQLIKPYTSGATTISRTISLPVAGALSLYLDGSITPSGYSIDNSTGLITFDSAPGSGVVITADYEFDLPARFDTDQLSARIENYGVRSWLDIPIIEVRR
ncbi:MAG: DUF2460 domain-containing protein [Rickettsiales bacterium]|nr:DUF2460 domain-containing protein [Rickettsiales bacterium]